MDVLVVDDVEAVRAGLAMHLSCVPWLRVTGQAADGESAVALVAQLRPDVVVMDIEMPVLDGIATARLLRDDDASLAIVLTSMHSDSVLIASALAAGADAFVSKCDGPDALVDAIREAARRRGGTDA